ncbi:carboxypeptidase regulatory-like domain-containing protein [Streptomyces sp. NPDC056464]|uniref:carboxypeptidase regulatory-like domain-containing protein n=1 Tax=Streptomyces sp. NPDC056464 TaxID=3345828 RepID=UPI0036CF9D58
MSGSWKTTILGVPAVVAATVAGATVVPGVAYGVDGPADGLWAAATVEPGREGVLHVRGFEAEASGEGSVLTLSAPAGTRVTGAPFAGLGYRGAVTRGGGSGTYTFASGAAAGPVSGWKGRTFPFVVSVAPDAEPGTRLADCTLVLRDAKGTVRQRGTCAVTVGLPAPTLSGPASGVPVSASPQTSGTAYPGAQITVRDALEEEVCTDTAAPDGSWSCVPGLALPVGAGRLQATATKNGVSALSEQIDIMVSGSGAAQKDTVSDDGGGRIPA